MLCAGTRRVFQVLAAAALILAGPVLASGAATIEVQFSNCIAPSSAISFQGGIGTFSITKPIDVCSPKIVEAVSTGKTLDVTLTFNQPSYQWIFAKITLASVFSNSGSGSAPTETVSWASAGGKLVYLSSKSAGKQHSHHVTRLDLGDSKINITNTGESAADIKSGTDATVTGAICANVYAFAPDEQMVSCCSCPVTPDGLVSLSARDDLVSNTLTPATPSALTVVVVPTAPLAGTCSNSATTASTATIAPGLVAWGTNVHGAPAPATFAVTETVFAETAVSDPEITRMATLCNFILADGGGFGICRSCRLGALGGSRQ
jgi:hypothetical protein